MRREKSIAVLPFIPLTSHQEDEFFCDGLTEEIINSLSHVKAFFITSRTSSFHFKNTLLEASDIASKLGVKYLVEGSLRKTEEKLRITVQLINAKEDFHLWSEVLDFTETDIFIIQDKVAQTVKKNTKKILEAAEQEETIGISAHNSIEAYALNLKAKQISADLSEANIKVALELVEKAIEIDPLNDKFLSTKALLVATLGIIGSWPLQVAGRQALTICEDIFAINSKNIDAHVIKGYMMFALTGNIYRFYNHINIALKEKPRDPFALYFISIVESAIGNLNKSVEAIDLAYEVDPMSLIPPYLRFLNLMRLRRYEEALEEADKFIAQYPNHQNACNVRGYIYLRLKQPDKALRQWSQLPAKKGQFIKFYGGMAMAYAIMGSISKAEHHLELSKKKDKNLSLAYCENPSVMVNLFLGRFELAFKELEKDIKIGKWYTRFYRTNPFFDPFLNDPRAKMFNVALVGLDLTESDKKIKYAKSGLTKEELKIIETKLKIYINEKKPYLDQKINLKKMANDLNISANKLSQVINSQNDKNFFDFINSLRIKHLLQKLNDKKNEKYTLLSLAFESGFNSKSTFNASFKKLTGLTPTQYIKFIEVTA